ncbi:MAG: hypothetical protein AB1458_01280 [Bacteroidota bacterium]
MRTGLYMLLCAFALASCKKEDDPPYSIMYRVEEITTSTPAYTVSYAAESATQTEGPIVSNKWSSPSIKKRAGEVASLTLDGGSGTGSFILRIYVNGVPLVEDTMDNPNGPKTISITL